LSRIYASLPLSGPAARAGREVLRGAELAAERASDSGAELVVLDGFGKDREEQAIANARQAVADADALAYLGEFHSSQVVETSPILAEARPPSGCAGRHLRRPGRGRRSCASCRTTAPAPVR
jgi:ABC-type branched-subunit amino acid transport system substrate-binding protein